MKKSFIFIDIILCSILFFLLIKIFLFQTYRVESVSMLPSLQPGDRLLCIKPIIFSYLTKNKKNGKIIFKKNIKRNDIVVFTVDIQPYEEYVKRVIGLPNERISIKNGKPMINDSFLQEPFVIYESVIQEENNFSYILGPDEYFLMGDNRDHSSDSRHFGPVKEKSIDGKCILIYWPIKHFKIFL